MSHEVESMFYVREVPWHGLGTQLPAEVTAAEAIKIAGLDWEVGLRPLWFETPAIAGQMSRMSEIADKRAIVRESDNSFFGIATPAYTPMQNRDAFTFFDNIVGSGQAIYHTAGSLRGGRVVWILAKLPQTAEIKGVDPVNNYLLLMNGHDGGLALRMHWTPIRVVCWNTLQSAMANIVGQQFYARHTAGIDKRVAEAQQTLGLAAKRFDGFIEQAERLANASFLKAELDEYLKAVLEFVPDEKPDEQRVTSKVKAIARITELVETGAGLQNPAIRGTKWAAYNAVTEFVDHERPTRAAAGRLDVAWLGSGADLKDRAWKLILN